MSSGASAYLRLVPPSAEPKPEPHRPTLDDSELLAAIRAGEPSAATALHDRARPVVSRTVARLLGGGDSDAEDVAQLAFIELVNTIERFRGECPLDAWISVITARIVYKHIRRRRLERRLFSSVPSQVFEVASESTRRDLVFREALRAIQKHLVRVDANRSWTFLLHDVYGYDLKEVASITGVSIAAAQSRLVRGCREVHERIQADPQMATMVRELCRAESTT